MNVADFDFDLPPGLIAQEPRPRGTSRLLVVNRAAGSWREASIADLPDLVVPGDLVVANDTRVFPARLLGRREPIRLGRQQLSPGATALPAGSSDASRPQRTRGIEGTNRS